MKLSMIAGGSRLMGFLQVCFAALVISGCGGGTSNSSSVATPANPDFQTAASNTVTATVLRAIPSNSEGAGVVGVADSPVIVHYHRNAAAGGAAADYTGWQIHTWGAAQSPNWNAGYDKVSDDAFGVVYNVPLAATNGDMGFLLHKGDTKDNNGADQHYTLAAGKNEIWRVEGDGASYDHNPLITVTPDLTAVRVHYMRYNTDYANWGLHMWADGNQNPLDTSRLPGVTMPGWGNPVPFSAMPNYSVGVSEVVFDFPVLNPTADVSRTSLTFLIHGMPPNNDPNLKDGHGDIHVDFGSLKITNQVGDVWILEGNPTVYYVAQDMRSSALSQAAAVWLNGQLIQWPHVYGTGGTIKLYYSTGGQIKARKDEKVSGADGYLNLDTFTGTVPATAVTRFKWLTAGGVFVVKTADIPKMSDLHKKQMVMVQEDATGLVQNAAATQIAGAMDDLYAAAANVTGLGATLSGGNTTFKLWAPTAMKVSVFTFDTPTGDAVSMSDLTFDSTTGVWSLSKTGDLSGKYYKYAVDVFVRGVGVVRNLVTDPYSVSLTTDSKRSYIADLNAANLKPAGWDADAPPATVTAATDMSIYELHVRDFSANDASVSSANRGKYLAFSEASSNGMKHLKALATAGLTDVHLLPTFDIASVSESGCTTPSIPLTFPADDLGQQNLVAATKDSDCFNWGYDPFHYTVPEGSYASDAADGAKRIVEFRTMVKSLHDAGLRVGMDVVYNHTTASGQNAKSVLDRIVPGYYHRTDDKGNVTTDTCCQDTATENQMMAKLMIDSVSTWARDYKVSSFRFDLMGMQPRAVMKDLKTKVAAAAGRPVQLLGEGWNFGNVANGARFEQAAQGKMAGDGIGTFGDQMRDKVRGGGCCDDNEWLVKNQGYLNGFYFDPNERNVTDSNTGSSGTLAWYGDVIKGAMAGSIGSYTLTTSWDAQLPLSDSNLAGVGYASQPDEVVNYVENHDNQTLFDSAVMKLPMSTSKADRARVQMLGAAIVSFSQGIAYYHAGMDTLRSKSLDRNSYNSGDWFNRLDWTYADNNFGVGMPFEGSATIAALMKPFLTAAAAIKPASTDIVWTKNAFQDLLKIRASSSLFHLRTADDIKSRLTFLNTGSSQVPTVLAAYLNGTGYAGANFSKLAYFINVDKTAQSVTIPAGLKAAFVLHPAHAAGADATVKTAAYNATTGTFSVPARTAVVFVVN
jgi:pullulanase/glycogen debranching enzyme